MTIKCKKKPKTCFLHFVSSKCQFFIKKLNTFFAILVVDLLEVLQQLTEVFCVDFEFDSKEEEISLGEGKSLGALVMLYRKSGKSSKVVLGEPCGVAAV